MSVSYLCIFESMFLIIHENSANISVNNIAFLPPMAVRGAGGGAERNSSRPDYHLVDLKARHEASLLGLGRK